MDPRLLNLTTQVFQVLNLVKSEDAALKIDNLFYRNVNPTTTVTLKQIRRGLRDGVYTFLSCVGTCKPPISP